MLKTQGLTPVTTDQGMAVAKKMNAQYMECSSREMRGVDEIFERAILTVVANDRKNQVPAASSSLGGSGSLGGDGGRSSMPGVGLPKRKKRKCQFL
jgi:Ras homolog gene family, member A